MSTKNIEPRAAKGPRACTTCAKAKSRCVPGPTADKCERCHRLNKPCWSQTPAPPRQRKEPKRTKVQELEQRLEDLTTRLEVATGRQASKPPPDEAASGEPNPILPPLAARKAWGPTSINMGHLFPGSLSAADMSDAEPAATRAANTTPATSTGSLNSTPAKGLDTFSSQASPGASTSTSDNRRSPPPRPMLPAMSFCPFAKHPRVEPREVGVSTGPWPHGAEAEEFLKNYQNVGVEVFPFVLAPPNMSAAEMQLERPYLWKGIMMASSHADGKRQIAVGSMLVQDLAMASFCEALKSLDMLQGLVVMIAWFHYNANSVQVTNLLFLARGLVSALGLCDKMENLKNRPPPEISSTDLEEARTLAGVYYLLTIVFTTNKKPDSVMESRYVENACGILETRVGNPLDCLSVWLCRIQMLSQSIATSVADAVRQPQQLPFHILVKSFRQNLFSFRAELPPSLTDNPVIRCHIHTAEMLLYEPALDERLGQSLQPCDRIPLLWQALQAAKEYWRVRTATRVPDRHSFICMSSYDFIHTFIVCFRLVLLNMPGWDTDMAKQELNLGPLLEIQLKQMETVMRQRFSCANTTTSGMEQELPPEAKERDPFWRLAFKVRQVRALFQIETPQSAVDRSAASHSAGGQSQDRESAPNIGAALDSVDVGMGMGVSFDGVGIDMPPMDGFDPDYWHEVFSDDAMMFYSGHVHDPVYSELAPLPFGTLESPWPI